MKEVWGLKDQIFITLWKEKGVGNILYVIMSKPQNEKLLWFKRWGVKIRPHPSLIVLLFLLWAVARIYIPIISPNFESREAWVLASFITLFCTFFLFLHLYVHGSMKWLLKEGNNNLARLGFLGDLAQERTWCSSAGKEILVSASGPLLHGLLALASYFLWNAQISPVWNTVSLFWIIFNLFIGALNLAPFYPFDGGRIFQALFPSTTERKIFLLGRAISSATFLWGLFLFFQGIRYSRESGSFTMLFALLIFLESGKTGNLAPSWKTLSRVKLWKVCLSLILMPSMLLSFLSSLPLASGIEAPGTALQVESMIKLPTELIHHHQGHFLLTSVFSQTPIIFAEWVYAKFNPNVEIVPPEQVIPPEVSAEEWMRMNYTDLEESEANAIYVALTLAGYHPVLEGKGARVVSINAESPAQGLLQKGDIIIQARGVKIEQAQDLKEVIASSDPQEKIKLTVKRGNEILFLETSLIKPQKPDEKPYLGIVVESAGVSLETPIPVEITPQKIVGGPSAGLMFSLSLYNLLMSNDLTKGKLIAGTGTIDPEGKVGAIGGVEIKVRAAEKAGAEYFLSPEENYQEALKAASKIKVIKVRTIQEAIAFLKSLD